MTTPVFRLTREARVELADGLVGELVSVVYSPFRDATRHTITGTLVAVAELNRSPR